MRFGFAILGVVLTLGVSGGCSSTDPEPALVGACGPGSCTLESVCAKRECGGWTSRYGADGCQRRGCGQSSDCDAGEQCVLQDGPSADSCEMQADGSCECQNTVDAVGAGRCVPQGEIPEETCWVPDGCVALSGVATTLELALPSVSGDLEQRVRECLSKQYAKQQELACPDTAS